jgi:hypothetical protein
MGFLIYEEIFNYICGGRWSNMTLQLIPSEFPYLYMRNFVFLKHKYFTNIHFPVSCTDIRRSLNFARMPLTNLFA